MMFMSMRLLRCCLAVVLCAVAVGCKGKPKENAVAAQSDPNEVVVTIALLGESEDMATPLMTDVTGTLQVAATCWRPMPAILRVSVHLSPGAF